MRIPKILMTLLITVLCISVTQASVSIIKPPGIVQTQIISPTRATIVSISPIVLQVVPVLQPDQIRIEHERLYFVNFYYNLGNGNSFTRQKKVSNYRYRYLFR